jgi:hypothetical protein
MRIMGRIIPRHMITICPVPFRSLVEQKFAKSIEMIQHAIELDLNVLGSTR